MTEPRRAYIATTITPEEVTQIGGIGSSGSNYTTHTDMYLNPTEAIRDCFKWLGKFLGDDTEVFIYQVDLSELEGVWPRVSHNQFNDTNLQWISSYFGQIPVSALTWLNVITKKRFIEANRVEP